MVSGAGSKEEIIDMAGVCNDCDGCRENLDYILGSVCGCMEVSLKDVVDAVKNGTNTVEKIGILTKVETGEDCGRCHALIQNIIELRH